MNNKYEILENDYIIKNGIKFNRIRALKNFGDVRAGDLGGYIQREYNLSQEGNSWIYDKSIVYQHAKVSDNAKIKGECFVSSNARIKDNAIIMGNCLISGDTRIGENARIFDNVDIHGKASVLGNAKIYDSTKICGQALICDSAIITGNSLIYGITRISGNTIIENMKIHTGYIDYSIKDNDINNLIVLFTHDNTITAVKTTNDVIFLNINSYIIDLDTFKKQISDDTLIPKLKHKSNLLSKDINYIESLLR